MRPKVGKEHLNRAMTIFNRALKKAIEEKGDGAFVSQHEALGVITEEQLELVQAVRANNADCERSELLDVAISAIWEVASMFARGDE